ncbi:MAG: DNA-processing protein DprA [Candidatus Saccharimonadales bacterium]
MNVKKLTITDSDYPQKLVRLSSPPKELFYLGANPQAWANETCVAVVGTRAITPYGRQVTEQLVTELCNRGVHIVSGLAFGVDAVAHTAAVKAGGQHVAVLAHGLNQIHPTSNTELAKDILRGGGTLLSEYEIGTPSLKQNFIARNRIVSGLATALLITEASEKSGTLHTARFALEQGIDVFVVPGNITSPQSAGTNNLIKAGAHPITSIDDITNILKLKSPSVATYRHKGDSDDEKALLTLLYDGTTDGHELLVSSSLSVEMFTQALTMLELSGKIYPLGNNHWAPK